MKTCIIFILFTLTLNISALDFWQQTNGPFGATVFSLTYTSAGTLFCGTMTGGGIFRSIDNGSNWTRVFGSERNSWSWAVMSDRNSNLYASCSGYGLIKSTDDGITWFQLTSLFTPYSIAVNAAGDIFAGTSAGNLYRSTDGGVNWSNVNYGPNGVRKLLIKPNGYVYSAFPPMVRMSTDNGDSWNQINYIGMTGGNDLALDSSGNLLVCNSNGIFRTSNDGVNWQQICNVSSLISVAVSGNGVIYSGDGYGKIIRSTDNGLNWLEIFNDPVYGSGSSVMDIVIKPDGKLFAGYYYLGIHRSLDDGSTWQKVNRGINNQRIAAITNTGNGKIFAGTFHDGLYCSTDLGASWSYAGLANKYAFSIGINGPNNIFVYTPIAQGGVFRSTNGGLDWHQIPNGFPTNGNVYKFITVNSIVFTATDNGLYKSTDNGDNWTTSGLNSERISYLVANNNNIIFVSAGSRIYRSVNLGLNWTMLDSLGYFVRGLSVYNSSNVYAISERGFFMSADFGNNWRLVDSLANYDNLSCSEIGELFATNNAGVSRSVNGGANWQQLNTGLTFKDITVLSFDDHGYLYAGTMGAGIFRSVHSIVNVQNTNFSNVPGHYQLYQNYPNPFNPVTNIKFEIPLSRGVDAEGGRGVLTKLIIYDLLGREVITLLDKQLQPGSYSIDWDATNYPSGVYFYSLLNGEASITKKMVLLK